MNEFAFEYNYNCKYYSTKSTLQNWHENFITFLWINLVLNITIIVSIVQQNQSCKTEIVVTSLWMNLLLNINVIVSTYRHRA